jgi:cytochrome P450
MTAVEGGPQPPQMRAGPRAFRAIFDRRRSIGLFERLASHGDVAELRGPKLRVWLVSDPAVAREVLVEKGRFFGKGRGIRLMQIMLGHGILTNEDPVSHKRNRRLINPAFSSSALRRYADVMVDAALRADERWSAGEVVEITDEMGRVTLDVVGRTLLGDDTDRDARVVIDAVQLSLKRFGLGFIPGIEKLLDTPLPPAVKLKTMITTMRDTVGRIVSEHRGDVVRREDIVTSLIEANVDGETLSEEQVRDETLTLMLAGFETTANALAWTWWLLDQSPDVAARLRDEIDVVLGDERATFDDLERLPFAMAVIAETMRLRPPAWIIEREAKEPLDVGGYHARVGTTILMSPWIIQRDPRWWGPDAAEYRPERWINAEGKFDHAAPGQPRGAYFPFGGGTRICIGEQFAWSEAVLVLVTLARRWAPVTEPSQDIKMWAAVTLRPHPGITMRLAPAQRRTVMSS